jgi:hypothetical protein
VSLDDAYAAAKLTGLAIPRSLQRALGDLDRIAAWGRVSGWSIPAPGFNRQPLVINGFSDLILELYGPEVGAYSRSAGGAPRSCRSTSPSRSKGEVELRA